MTNNFSLKHLGKEAYRLTIKKHKVTEINKHGQRLYGREKK